MQDSSLARLRNYVRERVQCILPLLTFLDYCGNAAYIHSSLKSLLMINLKGMFP